MCDVTNVIQKLINKQYDFCCLCFNTSKKRVHFDDEVIYYDNSYQNNIKVSEILSCVLGEEVFENLSEFEFICIECSTSALNSFKFIKEMKQNHKRLIDMIDLLKGNFDNLELTELSTFNTLYVALDSDLQASSQYRDNVICKDTRSAISIYNFIFDSKNLKIKDKRDVSSRKNEEVKMEPVRKKRSVHSVMEETRQMLYNSDDFSNIQCKECLATFGTLPNLRCHFYRRHAPKDFKCEKCFKGFGSASLLSNHINDCHKQCLICSDCGKVFNHIHTLRTHEKIHHVKLICQKCGRVYKNPNTYKKHIDNEICGAPTRRTQADAKFECDYCHRKYSQKMTLRVHIQYEHGNYKYLECKWCKKKFWCKSRLNAHIVKHTKERKFICTICNGKFVTKESLLYHTRIHTGEKPYKCPHCDCRFLNASRRAAHVKSQHVDPTVECDVCKAKFKSYHFLHKHKKLHKENETVNLAEDKVKGNNCDKSKNEGRKVIILTDQLDSDKKSNVEDGTKLYVCQEQDKVERKYCDKEGKKVIILTDQLNSDIYFEIEDEEVVSENVEV